VDLFKERKIGPTDLIKVTKVLTIEKFDQGSVIIDYGERGYKLYIMIRGVIEVNIPHPHIKNFRQKYKFMN
jgi:signal-transduction protein with cAMP-binding, CBS, and nucleotidyltransferase domain